MNLGNSLFGGFLFSIFKSFMKLYYRAIISFFYRKLELLSVLHGKRQYCKYIRTCILHDWDYITE